MKRFILIFLASLFYTLCIAQTTYFNSSPVVNGKEAVRLYSLENAEDHVIVTIEVEALKKRKRINYWTTANTYIVAGNNLGVAKVKGYYINGRIHPCGYDHQWGWSDVEKGTKNYYKLYFEGSIPSGCTTISIVDGGTQEWNGYNYSPVHSYCFNNFVINNPRRNFSSINSEYLAKNNIDANNDGVCGIYEQIGSEQNYKLACVKENGSYKLIYLSSTLGLSWWQAGDIKAYLSRSASGIFKAEWFMSDKSINRDVYLAFDDVSMTLNMPTGTDKGVTKYLKMYPANSSAGSSAKPRTEGGSQSYGWTGTGFALRNGFIVTNNHVVEGASKIVVQGVNGSSDEYNAEVVSVDKNNDLALIKIKDYRFDGFGPIPYSIKENLCDVGSDIFVLGYPLTSYMGEEIKLTNGIISSRSGYQGDVTTYQISAPIQPGNSGGPMFDKFGNVVGVVNAGIPGAENVGYAIKVSYLSNLINSTVSNAIIPRNNTISNMSLPEKVKILRNYTFYIKCK